MCQRLDCMKHLWQNNTGTGGQTSSTNNFWTQETGAVAQLWKDLAKAMEGKGKDDQTGCKELPNPSDKTACNFLHAGLEHLYKTPAATAPPGGVADVLKTNPSFRQTMGCFLLHAYAKHMKEKAVCDIEKGITTAFTAWEKPEGKANSCKDSSGKGQCVPCHWQEKDETWKNCTITTNGQAPDPNGTVGDKLKNIVKADDADIKEMAKVVNTVERLCDQVKCVTARWMKDKTKSWEEVWKKVEEELPKLGGALSTATSKEKRGDLEQYCDLPKVNGKDVDKEACLLIAAGLKNLYDIEEKNNDAVEASFQRTMQCVLLNAIADKLEHNDFPCKDEKNTKKGIDEAFTTKNSAIRNSTACGTNDKCFTCGRVTLQDLESCKLDSGGTDQNVKKKIEEEVLKKDGEGMKEMTKIWDQSIKDICKPCEQKELCDQLNCIAPKWSKNRSGQDYSGMITDASWIFGGLLDRMKDKGEAAATEYCRTDKDGTAWNESNAHGVANRTACEMVAGGLLRISKIKDTYSLDKNKNENPYDNQEYKQLAACFMLNAVVRKMKERSPICDIDEGIKAAFAKADDIKKKYCDNGKPCFVCKLDDNYDGCSATNGKNQNVNVKDKLDSLLKDSTNKNKLDSTIQAIAETAGNKGPSLCDRLQCLAARVEAHNGGSQAVSIME
ncbi:SICAvar, type I (fragment) [Plasmodium knowlesi strain H]|uniref:SICAvar, type I n=2 Tax=Plasmodium knowlesi TaxID=5850 RepID=A0A1A7VW79_PLAKH